MSRAKNPLKEYADPLRRLAYIWEEADNRALRYDTLRQTWVAAEYQPTYRRLFGSLWPLRAATWKGKAESMRRLVGRSLVSKRWKDSAVELPLPADAVVLQARQGLVVASARLGRALKVVSGQTKILELQNEKRGMRCAKRAGLEDKVPTIISEGEVEDEKEWVFMELAPNTRPLYKSFYTIDRVRAWPRWLRRHVLPVMERFYESTGVEWFAPREWLRSQKDKVRHEALPQDIAWLLELADRAIARGGDSKVPVALAHGDLRSDHVHRQGRHWKLIDWGGCRRRPIVADVFSGLALSDKYLHLSPMYWKLFCANLDVDDVDKVLGEYIYLYIKWMREWMGIGIDELDVQCQLVLDFLSECLYFWVKTGKLSNLHKIRIKNMKKYA